MSDDLTAAPDETEGRCLFCGKEQLALYTLTDADTNGVHWKQVYCRACNGSGPWGATYDEARTVYNQRADLCAPVDAEDDDTTPCPRCNKPCVGTGGLCTECGLSQEVTRLQAEAKARNILLLEVSGRGDLLKKEHVNPDALDGLVAVQNEFDRLRNIVIRELQAEVERLTAAWCLCGHTKKQHDSYCDHDECNGCIHESRDEPCSWFSPNTEERTNG